jgi:hypothetical protein
MRSRWFSPVALLGAGLCLAPLVGLGLLRGSEDVPAKGAKAPPATPAKAEPATCGSFGTNVEFVDTPSEAATKAKKEQKLVFVLHVSGNFEDPRFT